MAATMKTTKSWSVAVHSDLYLAGITEDGEQYTAEQFYVRLEKADGERYAHFKTFKGCVVEQMEDGYVSFQDVREDARKQAETLCNRIIEKGKVDLKYWSEIDPVYGSIAFQRINRF